MKNSNSWVYVRSQRILTYYLPLTFARSRKVTVRFVMNVRPSAWNNSAPIGRRCMTNDMSIFRKICRKIQFSLKSDKHKGYLTWKPMYIFDHISLNSSENAERCREHQNTHFIFSNVFRKSCSLWDNVEEYDKGSRWQYCACALHAG